MKRTPRRRPAPASKLPFIGFAVGLAILAVAWGIKTLNPIVRAILAITGAALALMHSKSIITQIRGAWRQI